MPELNNLSGTAKRIAELESELAGARERIKELEAKLETDPLLNVLNRRGFERELKRALVYSNRYRTSVGVLYVNIDNYKDVVDRHSLLAGDALLKAVSAAIVRDHRASDIVARFGGNMFVVLLWNLVEADARAKGEWIEQAIGALEVRFASSPLSVSVSTGLTMLKRFDSAENVIARAELDMRSRKQSRVAELQAAAAKPAAGHAAA